METTPTPPPGIPAGDTPPSPDFQGLANALAEQHQATRVVNRGGRRTAEAEAADWLRRNGLRAVPVVDSGPAGQGENPGPEVSPEVSPAPRFVLDPAFTASLVETAAKGIEASRMHEAFRRAIKKGADPELAREIANGNCAPPGVITTLGMVAAQLVEKWQLANQWTLEAIGIAAIGAWAMKDFGTMARIASVKVDPDDRDNDHD